VRSRGKHLVQNRLNKKKKKNNITTEPHLQFSRKQGQTVKYLKLQDINVQLLRR
jgi:hypothetical protein